MPYLRRIYTFNYQKPEGGFMKKLLMLMFLVPFAAAVSLQAKQAKVENEPKATRKIHAKAEKPKDIKGIQKTIRDLQGKIKSTHRNIQAALAKQFSEAKKKNETAMHEQAEKLAGHYKTLAEHQRKLTHNLARLLELKKGEVKAEKGK
jgi:predicted  nucleic acid-binding Zn-ribbon protein